MISENVQTIDSPAFLTYEEAVEGVKGEMERLLTTSPKVVRDYTRHLALSWGKLIRAYALLACAESREGLIHPNAVKFASAIELLHLATLVHDDVIDNSNMRRGMVTLQKKFGKRSAVICGDYLFCMAMRQAAAVQNKRDYIDLDMPDYMSRICLGELSQNQNNRNVYLSEYHYLKIIAGKTAALFEASYYAGAVVCKDAEEELKHYARLGHLVGMIFQLTDDCIDFEAPEQLAKKPVQSDFEQGVITLPLIYAFEQRTDLREKAKTEQLSRDEINQAVAETGGLNFTRLVSKRYYEKALKIIQELNASETKKERLKFILDKAYRGL